MYRTLMMLAISAGFVVSSACNLIKPPTKSGEPGMCMFDVTTQMKFGDLTCRNNAGQMRDVGSFNWMVLTPFDESTPYAHYIHNRVQITVSSESGCELHLLGAEVRESPTDFAGCVKHSDYDLIPAGGSYTCTGEDPYSSQFNWEEANRNGQPPLAANVVGQAICPAGYLD